MMRDWQRNKQTARKLMKEKINNKYQSANKQMGKCFIFNIYREDASPTCCLSLMTCFFLLLFFQTTDCSNFKNQSPKLPAIDKLRRFQMRGNANISSHLKII